jgi:hypothetical protein
MNAEALLRDALIRHHKSMLRVWARVETLAGRWAGTADLESACARFLSAEAQAARRRDVGEALLYHQELMNMQERENNE